MKAQLLFGCICALGLTAPAGTVLFSDLGASGDIYNCCSGWAVSGAGSDLGRLVINGNLFNSGTGGSISQIDLAVGNVSGADTFDAGIWTDVGGLPGTQVANASWTGLMAKEAWPNCCGLVTISGITDVTLAAGTDYFMVLGPVSDSDDSFNSWNNNNQSVIGLDVYSTDGSTWTYNGIGVIGAFDVLSGTSVPEPSTLMLSGLALGLLTAARRKMAR